MQIEAVALVPRIHSLKYIIESPTFKAFVDAILACTVRFVEENLLAVKLKRKIRSKWHALTEQFLSGTQIRIGKSNTVAQVFFR